MHKKHPHKGVTLIELLIAMGIISILAVTCLGGVSAVRRAGRDAASRTQLNALEVGLNSFKNIMGHFPPSHSDNREYPDLAVSPFEQITSSEVDLEQCGRGLGWYRWHECANDDGELPEGVIVVNGAHLLVWALAGADLLGSPGFKDISGDRQWWDDSGGEDPSAYALDDQASHPLHRRIGPFLDMARASVVRTADYIQDLPPGQLTHVAAQQPMLLDAFGAPILYYRANRARRQYTTTSAGEGIYRQADNRLFTGDGESIVGLDLGAGTGHQLNQFMPDGNEVNAQSDPTATDLNNYRGTFAHFIWDRKITTKNQPVRSDSFLLISAGPDTLYGTTDDCVNWNR